MSDKYNTYEKLCKDEKLKKDYRINWRKGTTHSAAIAGRKGRGYNWNFHLG